jgi:hypothetical protein
MLAKRDHTIGRGGGVVLTLTEPWDIYRDHGP